MLLLGSVFFLVKRFLIRVLVIIVRRGRIRVVSVMSRRRQLLSWLNKRGLNSAETTAIVSLMEKFLSVHEKWSEQMLELETERVRLERLRLEGSSPLEIPSGMLRVSEDEQDADWALKSGIITPSEYKDILEMTGLAPTDLEFN
jgi:hypothetical protein